MPSLKSVKSAGADGVQDAYVVPMSKDTFARHIFQHPQAADLFLRRYMDRCGLPLSAAPVVLVREKFVSDGQHVFEADAAFEAELANGEKIYILIEFKSGNAAATPGQLHRYMVQLWEHQRRTHPGESERRAIVPIVLYSGTPRWTAPTTGARIVGRARLRDALQARLAEFGCLLNYLLCDLARLDLQQLLDEPGLCAALRALTLTRYERRAYLEILQAFPAGHPLARGCTEHLCIIGGATRETVTGLLGSVHPPQWRKTMAAAIEGVYAEGMEKGQQAMLLKMLEKFFGPLSAQARKRIGAASPEQLESWTLAVRDAQSVDDVLNGSGR